MLDRKGFDLWAEGYDVSVGLSDESDEYPFAGYKNVLGKIFASVMEQEAKRVLDIGFGTGVLTAKLYEEGCEVYGQDFSEKMIALAQPKMPQAKLYQGDFSQGLVEPLRNLRYDAVIATYSLHHLDDDSKKEFIKELLTLLTPGGVIYIGDVAFKTRSDLDECRARYGDEWDDEEFYIVYEDFDSIAPNSSFMKCSHCAGVLKLWK